MPRTRTQWIALLIVVAVIGSIWIAATRVQPDEVNLSGRPPSPDIGNAAPDFVLLTPDGQEISLRDYHGTPVLINFWATWCPPCRAEIPALEQVSRELAGEVVILGVDVQESPAQVQSFMDRYGMTYPVVIDPDASVAQAYRVRAFPTTYFIDARGVVVELYTGPMTVPLLLTRLSEIAGQ